MWNIETIVPRLVVGMGHDLEVYLRGIVARRGLGWGEGGMEERGNWRKTGLLK